MKFSTFHNLVWHIMFNMYVWPIGRTLKKSNIAFECKSCCSTPEDSKLQAVDRKCTSSWPIFITDVHSVPFSVSQREGCTCIGRGNTPLNFSVMKRSMTSCCHNLNQTVHVLCVGSPSNNITSVILSDRWRFCSQKKDIMQPKSNHPWFVNTVGRPTPHGMDSSSMLDVTIGENRQWKMSHFLTSTCSAKSTRL